VERWPVGHPSDHRDAPEAKAGQTPTRKYKVLSAKQRMKPILRGQEAVAQAAIHPASGFGFSL
jgi:hypothetical protein